ncbi:MAG: transcriptional regulator [Candidatus Saccharimonadales bacterium]
MIEQLFGSKTRVKLLKLFYSNPNRPFYVREITRKIDEQINSVRRELSNLLSIGIISSDNNNNKLYYEVDQSYEFYAPLSAIFGGKPIKQTEGQIINDVKETEAASGLKTLGNVDIAIYTGQFTRDDTAGVDFVIIGDVNPTKVGKYVEELETKEGKEIRYVFMGTDEFLYRQKINDRFIALLLESKMQVLLDKHYLITEKPKIDIVKEPKKQTKKKEEE